MNINPGNRVGGGASLGQRFPEPEGRTRGGFGAALAMITAPLFLVLLALHALIGYVELGTDMWITKLTGEILASPGRGLLLFIYTSVLMFALRFVAGPLVHRISSLGLLLVSSVLGAVGLTLLGGAETVVALAAASLALAAASLTLARTLEGLGTLPGFP